MSLKMVYHIIDSKIVKATVSKESYKLITFTTNRIEEILQRSKSMVLN